MQLKMIQLSITNGESKRTDLYDEKKRKNRGTYNQEGIENQEYVNALFKTVKI
jgi:hypothetical protein